MARRDQDVHFLASKEEVARIHQKIDEIGVKSMGAYLRKMALDGYCINLDLRDVKELVSLLRRCSNNLNQYAKRANETGSIYQDDIKDVQERLDEVWEAAKEMLVIYPVFPNLRLEGSCGFARSFYIGVDIIADIYFPMYNIVRRKEMFL